MGGCASKPKEYNGKPPADVDPTPPELLAKSVETRATTSPPEQRKGEAADETVEKEPAKGESVSDASEPKPEPSLQDVMNSTAEPKTEPPQATAGPAEIVEENKELCPAKQTAEEVSSGDAKGAYQTPRATLQEVLDDQQKAVEVSENVKKGAPNGNVAEVSKAAQDATASLQSTAGGGGGVLGGASSQKDERVSSPKNVDIVAVSSTSVA